MITAINSKNDNLYKELFNQASDILSGYQSVQTYDKAITKYYYKDSNSKEYEELDIININDFANALVKRRKLFIPTKKGAIDGFAPELGTTTLEEYYNWLPELKRDSENKPTIFTKLPLDEPHFEINANTRAITIPNDFKKNGIGVQGDDLAEVVYFMIDRYFDAVDLNNTEIYIEWETPKGKNGTATKAVSEPYLKIIDDENYLGKLIFGWALSEAITKESGTLKFAVRFIQRNDDKKIVYSFNTLTAQVNIHPNLGVDMATAIESADNVNDRLLERIQESEVVGGAQAAIPYFLTNLVNLETDDGIRDIDNHKTGTYTLSAVAAADDPGAISYVWLRSELDKNNKPNDSWAEVDDGYSIELVALTEDELKAFNYKLPANRNYHIKPANEGSVALEAALYDLKDAAVQTKLKKIFGISAANTDEFIPTIYENRALLVVNEYGKYKVEARNRIFNSLTRTDSKVVTFRRPDAIEFVDNQTCDQHIIGTDSAVLAPEIVEAIGDLDFQWYKSDSSAAVAQDYIVTDVPENTKISYGENHIRIYVPEDTVFDHQEVGEGGNVDKYYITVKTYIPDGAVSTKHGFYGALGELKQLSDVFTATDERGFYRPVYIHVATYDSKTKTWVLLSANSTADKYEGFDYVSEFYDKDRKLIKSNEVRIDLANKDCWRELINYVPFEDIDENGIDKTTQQSYTATQPGKYQLKVTRTRNKAPIDKRSIEYRVTNEPEVPEFVTGTYDAVKIIPVNDLLAGTKILNVEWDNDIKSDEFRVAWYLYRGDKKMDDLNIVTYEISNAYSSVFNPADTLYTSVFEKAGEDIEGYYYAVVKNILNGVESAYNAGPIDAEGKLDPNKMFNVTGS